MTQPNLMATDPRLIPRLTDAQWERLTASGEVQQVERGDYLYRSGERDYPLILVESGEVELVRDALSWAGEEVLS
ncbi:MAG TPA: hypothetical protein VG369_03295, partial [Humibacter sp.]|nr:hypothetical protein [Humibacter sp.]